MITLKRLREEKKINQQKLAVAIGVSRSTIAMWETGNSQPDHDNLKLLAQYFGVSIDFLLNNPSPDSHAIRIPVLGKVVAGVPIEAVEDILDYEEISPDMASTGEFFALKITGKSMEPKFSEGDVIVVRQQPDVDNGDIAVVLINGNAATVKKVKKTPEGITLIPLNPAFDVLFLSNAEIESMPVTIIGKVIELRAKF